ncbi:MAG: hypothetical protein KDC24_14885 [Saprospiraceae bacterium]|nr:hypothetical protein [Saprospiraceae bacterium]
MFRELLNEWSGVWHHFPDYPPSQLILLGTGFILWVAAYYFIIKGVRKWKIVEIPMVVVALDIGWEFDWAFLLKSDLGLIFNIGCAVWFFMDIFINIYTLKYGKKLVTNNAIKKYYNYIYLFILIGGALLTFFMKETAEDNGLGIVSAYLINIMISSLYLYQLVTFPELRGKGFSYLVGWLKGLGTGAITIAVYLHWSHNPFLITICTVVLIMDIIYLYLYKNYKPELLQENAV